MLQYKCCFILLLVLLELVKFSSLSSNDRACEPMFTPASMYYRVSEHLRPGDTAASLLFFGDEAMIKFSLKPQSEFSKLFQVDGKRLVLREELDFEQWRKTRKSNPFILSIRCDVKTTLRSKDYNLSVEITDFNDNSPVITNLPETIDIAENSPVGTIVYHGIKAIDPDASPAGDAIMYLGGDSPHQQYFKVTMKAKNEANLVLVKPLDYRVFSKAKIKIIAKDYGDPPLTSEASTTINIIDVDNMDPIFFNDQYTAVVQSGSKPGVEVVPLQGPVEARDGDDGINTGVIYSMHDSTQDIPFLLHPVSGVITVNRPVEDPGEYLYKIQACQINNDNRCATSDLKISVITVNEHPPVLSQNELKLQLLRNDRNKDTELLSTLHVKDEDGISKLKTEMKCEGYAKYPPIDAVIEGSLIRIKRTTKVSFGGSDNFQCILKVLDGIFTDSCNIQVHTIAPLEFSSKRYTFKANLSNDTIIGSVKLSSDASHVVRYRVVSSDGHPAAGDVVCVDSKGKLSWCRMGTTPPREQYSFKVLASYPDFENSSMISADVIVQSPERYRRQERHGLFGGFKTSSSRTYLYSFIAVVAVVVLIIVLGLTFMALTRRRCCSRKPRGNPRGNGGGVGVGMPAVRRKYMSSSGFSRDYGAGMGQYSQLAILDHEEEKTSFRSDTDSCTMFSTSASSPLRHPRMMPCVWRGRSYLQTVNGMRNNGRSYTEQRRSCRSRDRLRDRHDEENLLNGRTIPMIADRKYGQSDGATVGQPTRSTACRGSFSSGVGRFCSPQHKLEAVNMNGNTPISSKLRSNDVVGIHKQDQLPTGPHQGKSTAIPKDEQYFVRNGLIIAPLSNCTIRSVSID